MGSTQHDRFAQTFLQCQGRIYGHIVLMLPNRHDAEDVFQQTSLILWQKWEQFNPEQDFLAWAYGIARNEVRNFLRRRQRDRLVLNDKLLDQLAHLRLEAQPMLDERRGLLAECIKMLDFMARELVERCYRGAESIRTIAKQFHTTPNALYLRLGRIRRELLDCIDRHLDRKESP